MRIRVHAFLPLSPSPEPFPIFTCRLLSREPFPLDLEDIPRLDVVVGRLVGPFAPRGLQDLVSGHLVERQEGAEDAEATVERQHAQVCPGIPSDRRGHIAVAVEEEFPQVAAAVVVFPCRFCLGFFCRVRPREGAAVRGSGVRVPLPPPLGLSLAFREVELL